MCVAGPAQPDLNGVNLALNRPATQISDATLPHLANASLSVDGNRNGYHNNLSCSHTGAEDNPWWMVDLDQDATISRVDIYYRMDSCCCTYIVGCSLCLQQEYHYSLVFLLFVRAKFYSGWNSGTTGPKSMKLGGKVH